MMPEGQVYDQSDGKFLPCFMDASNTADEQYLP